MWARRGTTRGRCDGPSVATSEPKPGLAEMGRRYIIFLGSMNKSLFFAAILCAGALAQAQQPQSWTSHDKLALTYFFYWYDAVTNKNLTLHPPESYLSTYSYDNLAFYQRELSDMAAAGIDV